MADYLHGVSPWDVVGDRAGNVLDNYAYTIHGSQADATANINSLGGVTSDQLGRWTWTGPAVVWLRGQNGEVWQVASAEAVGAHEDRLTLLESQPQWWHGDGPPAAIAGAAAGDFYLDNTTGDIYILDGTETAAA